MSYRARGPSKGTGQRALAGLTVLSACTLAGSWLSLSWPQPEAHAAQPAPAAALREPRAATVLLAEFETRTSAPSAREQRAQQLAAARVHGRRLAPGEVFDWNANASVPCASSGCLDQLASTLHAAAFFAGLPIRERAPQARPSFYIRLGLEAAVQPGRANLRFVNDRASPIMLELEVDAGRVLARLRGASQDLGVTLLRDVRATGPIPEQLELDPSLPRGMRVLAQRGTPGLEVEVQRILVDHMRGRSVHERQQHSYPPSLQLWRVGMANGPDARFVRPRNDANPEYVADAHLEMTQTAPGSIAVRRDAGATGSYGWTARAGMLVRRE